MKLNGKRILIVDDEPLLLELVQEVFEFEGASTEVACNGTVALDWLKKK